MYVFFFFKQKTAYEMRISDWSSDVCSSDLAQSADRGAADRGAVDRGAVNRIIDEGTNHSQVMQTAQYLSDMIGARLTNSPAMRKAEDWTQSRFRDWGLNVHKEGFEFGRGWWIERSQVRMTTPRPIEQIGRAHV